MSLAGALFESNVNKCFGKKPEETSNLFLCFFADPLERDEAEESDELDELDDDEESEDELLDDLELELELLLLLDDLELSQDISFDVLRDIISLQEPSA